MEVILLENIDNIGRSGEVVSVKDGFARNCLVPAGRAVFVTADNLRRAEILKKKYVQEEMERLGVLKELAAKLGTVSIKIEAKASEEGNLFGSVGANQILDALKEQGFEIELKSVKLEENIRKVGVYSVPIALHGDKIKADIKLWVVEEKEDGASDLPSEVSEESDSDQVD
jgi:large subunit ribosomal protein L9